MADFLPEIPEEYITKIRNTGVTVVDKIETINGESHRNIHYYYGDYTLGYLTSAGFYENGNWKPAWSIYIRVLMNVKYKFTKSKAIPKIEIKTSVRKKFEIDKIDDVANWLKLMVLWLKTAEAKKKKIMVDVEFEP